MEPASFLRSAAHDRRSDRCPHSEKPASSAISGVGEIDQIYARSALDRAPRGEVQDLLFAPRPTADWLGLVGPYESLDDITH